MSESKDAKKSRSVTYEAPKVSEENLDEGGNYVSPASQSDSAPDRSVDSRPLGTSRIE